MVQTTAFGPLRDEMLSRGERIMTKLEGKVAVITGGNSGIGLATARRFVSEGAYVYITGRRQRELDKAVQQIGKHVTAVQGDVSNLADLDRLYDLVKRQHGRVDVLFANAGGGDVAPLGEISEEQFNNTFNSDVKGVLFTVQKALPLLHKGSSVILNAGVAASTALGEGVSVFSAAKAAVQFKVHMLDETPMGRMGAPDEVAKAVLFLASDDSSFITGIELFVDGGLAQV